MIYPAVIVGDWSLGTWHYNGLQSGRVNSRVMEGVFSGVSVRFGSADPLSGTLRDCRDSGSLENFMLQADEIERIHPDLGAAQSRSIFVDHVDLPVLLGYGEWRSKDLLWRVSASAIGPTSEGVALIFLPMFSKLRDDYLRENTETLAPPRFRAGAVGCMDFFAKSPGD